MFTIADIRNIAIQIERNGERAYREAAKNAEDPEVARVLEEMADEERAHGEWFASINLEKPLTEQQREMEAIGRTILQDMVKNQTFSLEQSNLERCSTPRDVYIQSQTFEQDTILFYEMLSGFLDNEETMKVLNAIIAEERCHLQKLKSLARSVHA